MGEHQLEAVLRALTAQGRPRGRGRGQGRAALEEGGCCVGAWQWAVGGHGAGAEVVGQVEEQTAGRWLWRETAQTTHRARARCLALPLLLPSQHL